MCTPQRDGGSTVEALNGQAVISLEKRQPMDLTQNSKHAFAPYRVLGTSLLLAFQRAQLPQITCKLLKYHQKHTITFSIEHAQTRTNQNQYASHALFTWHPFPLHERIWYSTQRRPIKPHVCPIAN